MLCDRPCLMVTGIISVTVFAAAAASLALVACDRGPARSAAGGAIAVGVGHAESRELPIVIPAIGALRAEQRVRITTEIPGTLVEIHVIDGQLVKTGELIATIDSTEQLAALERANTELARAELDVSRTQRAFQQQSATELEVKTAQANRDAEAAIVKAAHAALAKCQITAPFDGRLSRRLTEPGNLIASGAAIADLETPGVTLVDFEVPEEKLTLLKRGLPIKVFVAIDGDDAPRELAATVENFGPQVKRRTHSLPVRGRLSAPEPALASGMFARIEVILGAEAAIVVPMSAVIFGTDHDSVWIVEGTAATVRRVTTVPPLDGLVEIRSGLQVSEEVVTEGAEELRESPAEIRRLNESVS